MLFAGHETTAHSIAATLGFLSIDPALQQEVYDQIVEVVGLDRDPVSPPLISYMDIQLTDP